MKRSISIAALCLASLFVALCILSEWANAGDLVVNAGPDLTVYGVSAKIRGSVKNRRPLNFWTADGNNATENMLIKYASISGVSAVGPLRDRFGKLFGWPSDFEDIGGTVYGFDTYNQQLYKLDANTGIVTPVGAVLPYARIFGLAYDNFQNKLYAIDEATRTLVLIDTATGDSSEVVTLPPAYKDVRGIAYNPTDGKLYLCDDATGTIGRIDTTNGQVETVLVLRNVTNALVEEIAFYYGRLFGSLQKFDPVSNIWFMQLVEFDLQQLKMYVLSPRINDVSAHSLLLNSIPEKVYWKQVDGPGIASIKSVTSPKTRVKFPQPGVYVLELVAEDPGIIISDSVTVTVISDSSAD